MGDVPKTAEEARWFREGYLCGAVAYAASVGAPTDKADNPTLAALFADADNSVPVVLGGAAPAAKDGGNCAPGKASRRGVK